MRVILHLLKLLISSPVHNRIATVVTAKGKLAEACLVHVRTDTTKTSQLPKAAFKHYGNSELRVSK